MKKKIGYFSFGIVLVLLLGFSSGRAETSVAMEDWILGETAAVVGLAPDSAQKGDLERIKFPLTGTELFLVKLVDTETDEAQIIARLSQGP